MAKIQNTITPNCTSLLRGKSIIRLVNHFGPSNHLVDSVEVVINWSGVFNLVILIAIGNNNSELSLLSTYYIKLVGSTLKRL